MKQQLKIWIAIPFFIFFAAIATAQQKTNRSIVSEMGYWVVESNVSTPLSHIIRFYSNENELVYTEALQGVKLKLNKLKVRLQLKEVLATSILAWQKNREPQENKALVSVKLKN